MRHTSPTALALLLGLLACGGSGDGPAKPPPGRVAAVEAKAEAPVDVKEFCEPWREADAAMPFAYPTLAAGTGPTGKRRWVNVWATWCAPCIEELPRLVQWRSDLAADGVPTDLVLLSVDGDPEAVASFRASHPEVQGSLEIQNADALGGWLTSMGLPEGGVLPIHLFIDGADKLRCVRMAGVGENDYAAVKTVLAGI